MKIFLEHGDVAVSIREDASSPYIAAPSGVVRERTVEIRSRILCGEILRSDAEVLRVLLRMALRATDEAESRRVQEAADHG